MHDTGFIKKKNSCTIVLQKGSRNMWSKCADDNFNMNFVVCVFATKSVAPTLLILPGKWLNRDVIEGCNIEVDNITTASKKFNQLYFIFNLY